MELVVPAIHLETHAARFRGNTISTPSLRWTSSPQSWAPRQFQKPRFVNPGRMFEFIRFPG